MDVIGSVACNGNPVKKIVVPSCGRSFEIVATSKAILLSVERSLMVLHTATSNPAFTWQAPASKRNQVTSGSLSRAHPPTGNVMTVLQMSFKGLESNAEITWLAVINVPLLSTMKPVPTIW